MKSEFFRYELLDNQDNVLGKLDGVEEGYLEFNTANIASGELHMSSIDQLNFMHNRVRVSMVKEDVVYPLLTGIPTVPSQAFTSTSINIQVDIRDKTAILRDDAFGYSVQYPAGTNVINAVIDVIESTGEYAHGIDASADVLTTNLLFEPTANKLQIVNGLLEAANYFVLRCDGLGRFVARKKDKPEDRQVVYTFKDDETGVYLPVFTRSYNPYGVPNRYVCIGASEGTETDGNGAAFAVAMDLDDASPFSVQNVGRWVTKVDTDVKHTGNLQEIAEQRLAESRTIGETFNITHEFINGLGLNDVVVFAHSALGERRAVVQSLKYTLETGGLVETGLRVVV